MIMLLTNPRQPLRFRMAVEIGIKNTIACPMDTTIRPLFLIFQKQSIMDTGQMRKKGSNLRVPLCPWLFQLV